MAPTKQQAPPGLSAPTEEHRDHRPTRRRRWSSRPANALLEALVRLGGEPFLAPFELGLTSLTRGLVARLKQRSFFALETFERSSEAINGGRPNKYTRVGASPFNGDYHRSSPQKKG